VPDVVKHAWTHRPKALGGTDPIATGLPFMTVYGTDTQVVTAGAYAEYEFWTSNNTDVFESPLGTDDHLIIKVPGMYLALAMVEVISGDQSLARGMYTQIQPDNTYPTFGTEWGWNVPWAFDTTLIDSSNVRLVHMGLGTIVEDPSTFPWRAVIVLTKPGSNYTTNVRALTVFRLNDGSTTGWTIGQVPT
jgi:hypothetical protein